MIARTQREFHFGTEITGTNTTIKNFRQSSEMEMETFQNLVQCEKCKKTFENNIYLAIHMKIHYDPRPSICESCPSSFKDPSAFSRNKNVQRENAKIFTCDVCRKEFKTNSNLYGHKKFHSDKHLEQMNIMNKLAVLNAKRLSRSKGL